MMEELGKAIELIVSVPLLSVVTVLLAFGAATFIFMKII